MSQFELNKEFVGLVRAAVEEQNSKLIKKEVEKLHPADIADVLHEINMDEAKFVYSCLKSEIGAAVLVELDEDVREKFLKELSSQEIADSAKEMDSDDAADVIAELPDDIQEDVISRIDDVEQASDIVDLLNYPEGTAGALMAKELIKVKETWTVTQCTREMRKQAKNVDYVYTVYVVDDHDKLIGWLSLKRLLLTPDKTVVSKIVKRDVVSVRAKTPLEDVTSIMKKYDLVVLPIVDEIDRLLGRITIDDALDVIQEEADKDYQMASGHTEVVDSTDSVYTLSRARLPWLLVGLLGGICGAKVIGIYEGQIQLYPEMAFFIPLIAAMGGNVGVQSSSIIVQGLANNTLGLDSVLQKIWKELSVALVNGLVCSVLILGYCLVFSESLKISVTVSAAIFSVNNFAGNIGTLNPMVIKKYKIYPAMA
ncbi:MAG: magnesium transporter, partial [Flavobacteriales bacterium]|nr:magnesium transporter [Flavobacteriales bacterium]